MPGDVDGAGRNCRLALLTALFLWACSFPLGSSGAEASWTLRHDGGPGSGILWGVGAGPAGLIAVGTNGTLLQSLDGQSWRLRDTGGRTWLLSCAYGNGKYVVVGDRGTVLTSTDGESWTPQARQTNERLNRVVYGGGSFVAVGEAETIITSEDGEHWILAHGGGANWLRGLVFLQENNGKAWLATGQNGVAYVSADARVWSVSTGILGNDIEAVQYDTQQFIFSKFLPLEAGWFYLVAGGGGDGVRRLTFSASINQGVISLGDVTCTASDPVVDGRGRRLRAVVAVPGTRRFQLFGDAGTVIDGTTPNSGTSASWVERSLPVALDAMDATTYSGHRYVVGDDLRILESEAPEPVRFSNLSTRADVRIGEQVMIAGAIVSGSKPKRVLVRALGPTLVDYGVVIALAAPHIEVFQGEVRVGEVGPWSERADADAIRAALAQVGAPALDPARKDAAAVLELAPGATTLVVSGANQTSGVALVDLFDLEPRGEPGRLYNLSTRGYAGPGEQTMIAGLIIDGTRPKTVLIRGLGAKLSEYGIARPLADPVLTLYEGEHVLTSNDDWTRPEGSQSPFGGTTSAAELRTTMKSLNLSSLDNYPKEAVLVVTLRPGAYTVHLSGNGFTGTALIEAFELPY